MKRASVQSPPACALHAILFWWELRAGFFSAKSGKNAHNEKCKTRSEILVIKCQSSFRPGNLQSWFWFFWFFLLMDQRISIKTYDSSMDQRTLVFVPSAPPQYAKHLPDMARGDDNNKYSLRLGGGYKRKESIQNSIEIEITLMSHSKTIKIKPRPIVRGSFIRAQTELLLQRYSTCCSPIESIEWSSMLSN